MPQSRVSDRPLQPSSIDYESPRLEAPQGQKNSLDQLVLTKKFRF